MKECMKWLNKCILPALPVFAQVFLCPSHDFLFGLITKANCTFPSEYKAHSVSSSLNLLTSNHERRQVTVTCLGLPGLKGELERYVNSLICQKNRKIN